MKFKGISDEMWKAIDPLFPPPAKEGRPRADDRQTLDGILYVLKTGTPWNDLREKYGDDITAWRRLKEWEEKGVWKKIMDTLVTKGYAEGVLDMDTLSIDSDTIPAKKGATLLAMMATRRSREPRSMRL
jgi:transposase